MPTSTKGIYKEKNFLLKFCDRVTTISLALIFLLIPIFFTGSVSQGIVFEKAMIFFLLVLLSLVAWITKGVIEGELKLKRTPLDFPLLVLAIILLFSTIFSVDRTASLLGSAGATTKSLVALIAYITFYYLLVNNITYDKIKLFVGALFIGLAVTIVYSAMQIWGIFVLPFDFAKTVSFNTIGTISSLGIYIASLLPLLAVLAPFLISSEEEKKMLSKISVLIFRILIIALTLFAMGILFVLNNFIFWPIAILGMVVLLMFVLPKIVKLQQADFILPVAIFLVLIIILVGGNFNLVNVQLPTEVSITRDLSWQISKGSLKENPFLGSGPATFIYDFAKHRGVDFNISDLWNVRFDTASGVLFEMLSTIGILGTFGFLAIGLILISVVFISLMKSEDKKIKMILLGIFASLSVLVINALLFNISGTLILLIIMLSSLAMSLVITDYPERFKEIVLSFRASPKYALALSSLFLLISAGVVILFTMGFKIYIADIYAQQINTRQNIQQIIVDLNKSVATVDYQDQYYRQLSQYYMTLANQEVGKGAEASQAIIERNLTLAIEAGKKAVELAPNNVTNNESLALVYENASLYVRGALEWAEKHYNRVIELEPDSPAAYIRLALIKVTQGNSEESAEEKEYYYKEAMKYYEQAISKKSNLAPAYYGMAIVQERLQDNDKAIEQLGQAVSLASNNLDYRFELGRLYFNRGVSSQSLQQQQSAEITAAEDENEAIDEEELSVEQKETVLPNKVEKNDDIKIAEAIFLNILEFSPNHANSTYSLALIYETVGENQNAIKYYMQLLEVLPDGDTKEAVREKLRSM